MMRTAKMSPYLFVFPALAFMGLFVYYPVVKNLQYSLLKWDPLALTQQFVGLKNYITLFHDPVFLLSLRNTTIYAVISVIFQIFISLVIAAILEDVIFRKISAIFRTIYFIPVLISMTVIGLLFQFIYNPSVGLLNETLKLIGLSHFAMSWLGNSKTAMYAVITVSQWQSMGFTIMLFVVAIQKIAPELYEAAKIDGAARIRTFFSITLPQVKEMTFVTCIYTITGSFLVFNEVYVITGGGPGYSSQVPSTYLYQQAFIYNNMGYAAAIANVLLAITIIFTLIQTKLFKTGKE